MYQLFGVFDATAIRKVWTWKPLNISLDYRRWIASETPQK